MMRPCCHLTAGYFRHCDTGFGEYAGAVVCTSRRTCLAGVVGSKCLAQIVTGLLPGEFQHGLRGTQVGAGIEHLFDVEVKSCEISAVDLCQADIDGMSGLN